jgi:hypothetical protein
MARKLRATGIQKGAGGDLTQNNVKIAWVQEKIEMSPFIYNSRP